MELYAVKIVKTGKYILWCDECWYETTTDSTPKYSYDRAREITEQMKDYNTTILQLTNQVAELTAKVDEVTGDVVSIGKCGENINYTLYNTK